MFQAFSFFQLSFICFLSLIFIYFSLSKKEISLSLQNYLIEKEVFMQAISLKQQIISDLDLLDQMGMLLVLWQLVEVMKQQIRLFPQEINPVLRHAGCLSDEDAEEIRQIIDQEFNTIEGEW